METTSNISYEFNSDITANTSQVLILFCCSSKNTKEKGDLYELFSQKFPYADVYSLLEKDAIPGSIKAFGKKSEGQRVIIAVFAQMYFGEPSGKKDTASARVEWLDKALGKIFSIKGLESIAFPYRIGCGINEEDQEKYRSSIIHYAKGFPKIEVALVSDEDDPNASVSESASESEEESTTPSEKEEISDKEAIEEESDDDETEEEHTEKDIKKKIESLDTFMKNHPPPSKKIVSNEKPSEEIPEAFYKWFWEEVQNLPYINPAYFLKMYKNSHPIASSSNTTRMSSTSERRDSTPELSWETTSLLQYTKSHIPKSYEAFFEEVMEMECLETLSSFLEKEKKLYSIQPEITNIYKAFELCPMHQMKVIILGQDPYPTKGAAVGVAFGTPGRIQPSLRNIYALLEKDGYRSNPNSGNLEKWCKQGVFLLNTALTVREGEAGSHLAKKENGPWETFTRHLLRHLDEKIERMVVILWGNHAKEYRKYFSDKHHIIQSSHPASSCYGGSSDFLDSMCFSKANRKLRVWKMEEIDWNLA